MAVSSGVWVAIVVGVWLLAGCGEGQEDVGKPYTVENGKVDAKTLQGWQTWRAAGCQRCHDDTGRSVAMGPSLVESLKKLSRSDFKSTVMKGRMDKGMPAFGDDPQVADHLEALYAYLKARSDGAIPPGKPTALGS
jgi:mono/diheme cytochrome c family protein